MSDTVAAMSIGRMKQMKQELMRSEVRAEIKPLQDDIAELKKQSETSKTDIGSLKQKADQHTLQVDNLNERMAKIETNPDIQAAPAAPVQPMTTAIAVLTSSAVYPGCETNNTQNKEVEDKLVLQFSDSLGDLSNDNMPDTVKAVLAESMADTDDVAKLKISDTYNNRKGKTCAKLAVSGGSRVRTALRDKWAPLKDNKRASILKHDGKQVHVSIPQPNYQTQRNDLLFQYVCEVAMLTKLQEENFEVDLRKRTISHKATSTIVARQSRTSWNPFLDEGAIK